MTYITEEMVMDAKDYGFKLKTENGEPTAYLKGEDGEEITYKVPVSFLLYTSSKTMAREGISYEDGSRLIVRWQGTDAITTPSIIDNLNFFFNREVDGKVNPYTAVQLEREGGDTVVGSFRICVDFSHGIVVPIGGVDIDTTTQTVYYTPDLAIADSLLALNRAKHAIVYEVEKLKIEQTKGDK